LLEEALERSVGRDALSDVGELLVGEGDAHGLVLHLPRPIVIGTMPVGWVIMAPAVVASGALEEAALHAAREQESHPRDE
jgi:hypothetical protein